jgi:glycosyltransferase involved in cell wall biosynthesis
MKIAIDGSPFTKNPLGIGKIIMPLIGEIISENPSDEYIVYSNKEVVIPSELIHYLQVKKSSPIFKYLPYIVWLKLIAGFIINRDKIDVYFSGKGFYPNISKKIKKIALVHDLNYLLVPQTMEYSHYLANKFFLKKDALKSDFLIGNSVGTAHKIEKYWKGKVDLVVNPPIDTSLFKRLPDAVISNILDKYNIGYKYFFALGTLEPRKNLELTITVFIDLVKNNQNYGHKLIIAGSKGWKDTKIIDLLDKYSDYVIHLGYVKYEDLPALYNGATAFLFPSIYEGFGIPVREALLCGAQIITSDIEELRETAYNNAYFINPLSFSEYKQRMLDILNGKLINQEFNHSRSNIDKLIKFINS